MNTGQLDALWLLLAAAMVLLMQAGFCLLESGLVRGKNGINVAMKNIADFCVSGLLFWSIGFGCMFGVSYSGLIGQGFVDSPLDSPDQIAFLLFQLLFCGTAATIVSGSIAERSSFAGYILITAVLSLCIYPIFGHWAWGGQLGGELGFLAERGFIDFAGSSVVHGVGGWAALAATLFVGPRLGRFSKKRHSMRGQNLPLAACGLLILWFGWFGFNGGSTSAFDVRLPVIVLNTNLAAMSGGLIALILTWLISRRPQAEYTLNGIIAGLVGITAGCHVLPPANACICGAIAGLLATMGHYLLAKLKIDDVVGAVSAHGIAGTWGTIAVALLGTPSKIGTGLSFWEQLAIQTSGATICAAFAFSVTFIACIVINKVCPIRVSGRDELIGLNVSEHGSSTEMLDLERQILTQSRVGNFGVRLSTSNLTETQAFAHKYNHLLDRVQFEIEKREIASNHLQNAKSQFYSLIANAREGLFTLTYSGEIQHANPACAQILGFASPTELKRGVQDFALDVLDNPADWKNLLRQLETENHIDEFEAKIIKPDGEPAWISINVGYAELRRRSRYLECSIIDITDRYQAENLAVEKRRLDALNDRLSQEIADRREAECSARLNEQRFRALFNSTHDAILISEKGVIVECNDAAIRMFDYPDFESLIGTPLIDLCAQPKINERDFSEAVAAARTQDSPSQFSSFEWICTQRNGNTFPCEVFPAEIDLDGVSVLQLTLHNLTDRNQRIRELIKAKDEAQSANKAKSEFLANVSHEIRTPLNGIIGYTDLLLRDGVDNERCKTHLPTIRSSGQHLLRIINDVLDFSKIESGKVTYEVRQCSPHAVLREVVSILRVMAVEKGLDLRCKWEGRIPAEIQTDPARLRQLLMNVVGNAIKFTDQGFVEITASAVNHPAAPILVFHVEDTGIGIAPEKIDNIFGAFEQVDNSNTRTFGGTGLGLAISKDIARRLGGDIAVESAPGQGSTFIISVATGPITSYLEEEQSEALVLEPASSDNSGLIGKEIFVCDDGATNRELIGLVLREAGAQVSFACDGEEGLKQCEQNFNQFDLVLMDVQMPRMDGLECVRTLRKRGWEKPIVALTAHAMQQDQDRCLEAGCTHFLSKPINIEELLRVCEELTEECVPETKLEDTLRSTHEIPEKLSSAEQNTQLCATPQTERIISTLPIADVRFQQIVDNFLKELDKHLGALEEAIDSRDNETIASQAHWLRGSAGTVGFCSFSEPATSLEDAANADAPEEIQKSLREIYELKNQIHCPWHTPHELEQS